MKDFRVAVPPATRPARGHAQPLTNERARQKPFVCTRACELEFLTNSVKSRDLFPPRATAADSGHPISRLTYP